MDIKGKNVILTGASSGIGYDLLNQLLELDCKVIAVSRRISKSEIEHENLYKFDCDMSNAQNIDKVFDYALKTVDKIDIYIANAGFAYYERLGKPDWEHIEKIFKTNVFSAFYAAQKMKEIYQDSPYNIVITASGMSFISLPGYSLYSSTKAALRGFADAYRYELSKGQHLQIVYPIATKTNFFEAAGDIPMAWPSQDSALVAKKIIKGIQKDKKNIHPSYLFSTFKYFAGIMPPFVGVYNATSHRAFREWEMKNREDK